MQTVSNRYRQIANGDYIVQSKIEMYDPPDKDKDFTLTVSIHSSHPPDGGVIIIPKTWEANKIYGGQNGQFSFTRINGIWYSNYGTPDQHRVWDIIENLGIRGISSDPFWLWHENDNLIVNRTAKVRPLLSTFYDDKIISLHPTWNVYVQDNPTIGGCYSGQNRIQLKVYSTPIPTMAEFRVYKRIAIGNEASEWLPHGIYYVDTREKDEELETMTFQCYDSMLKAEQVYKDITGIKTWPINDLDCVKNICSLMGIGFDQRGWNAEMSEGSYVGYPNDKTMREILGEIAVAHGGNFIISYEGNLRFIPFKGYNPNAIHYLNKKWEEFKPKSVFEPFRQVTIAYGEENAFSYPYPLIDMEVWEKSVLGKTNGDFEFTVVRMAAGTPVWSYNGSLTFIGTYGLTFIGTPAEGDKIIVTREQDISVSAVRNQREDPVEVDLAIWDLSSLGGHNGSYQFTYLVDDEAPANTGWYYSGNKVVLSDYGITFGMASDNNDQIVITRFQGQRARATISSSDEGLTVAIDTATWEDSTFGGTDGTYEFTYMNVINMTQQQSDTVTPVQITGVNLDRWEDTFGMMDGTYVLTYSAEGWKCTSGPDDPPEGPFVLSYIGLTFTGVPQNGDTITVVRNSTARIWRYQKTTINLVTLGISLIGSPNVGDTLTVVRDMEDVDEINGASTIPELSLVIDSDVWEGFQLGKNDGSFRFTYSGENHQWEYLSGELLIPINLEQAGITYELTPDPGDIITVERTSGILSLVAEVLCNGRVLQGECSFATQAMTERIYRYIKDYSYKPYEISNAIIDPALEPGDTICPYFSGTAQTYILASIDVEQEYMYAAAIGAPGDEEVNHEYEYKSQTQKDLSRKVTLGQPYYGTSISREQGIVIERSDGASKAIFNSDKFTMQALIDGTMQDRVYFDPIQGDYVFTGALAADAVFTDSLYAEQGYVAELTVDRLTTSRRIREYLLDHYYRETPSYNDDNFVEIQGVYIKWITGSVIFTEDGETRIAMEEQAVNRNGNPLFWDGMVRSCTSDGYPLGENGNQLYSTEKDTGHPIIIYQYNELEKMQALFESDGMNYAPRIIFGAGDNHGYNKCYMYKATDGLHIDYVNRYGTTDSISHLETEDFWRLNGIGIAPVDVMPEEPKHDVIYLTPEED